jgi:hypothetical protein
MWERSQRACGMAPMVTVASAGTVFGTRNGLNTRLGNGAHDFFSKPFSSDGITAGSSRNRQLANQARSRGSSRYFVRRNRVNAPGSPSRSRSPGSSGSRSGSSPSV